MKTFIPTYLRALHMHGPDAIAFIQSQVTLDIESTEPQHFYPAAWCDAKGRALSVMLIASRQDHVMTILPEKQAKAITGRLKMFSIGRKVEFSTTQTIQARIQNSGKPSAVDQDWCPLIFDRMRAINMRSIVDGDLANKAAADPLLDQQWQAADLAHRIPWITQETSGLFIPQMLGLETLNGLSYHKGCYPGQEVIARVHYRGKVVRKTIDFEFTGTQAINPGQQFEIADGKGIVLYSMNNPAIQQSELHENRIRGLAVVPIAVEAGQTFRCNSMNGKIIAL